MIVFSDMDGTFLTSTKAVSARSLEALDALAARGIEFVPCTGRALVGIPPEVLGHPAVHYAISSNGAVVSRLDPENKTADAATALRLVPLAPESALAVWDIARDHDVTFDIFADGHSYLRRDLYDRMAEFVPDPSTLASMRWNRMPVDEEPEQTIARVDALERLAMYWYDPSDRDAIVEALRHVDNITVTRSYPMNIEVMDKDASKAASMAWLCEQLGMSAADAVAFGDNFNDMSMIELAGLGVAVANAETEVREAADMCCASNDEDGVASVILERLGLS